MMKDATNSPQSGYKIVSPQANAWGKRSDAVDHIMDNAESIPAYSQIVDMSTGNRFNLLGERLHIMSEETWSQLNTILVLCFIASSTEAPQRDAVLLMLRSQLNDLLSTLPKSHQDEVVERAMRLMSQQGDEDKPIEDLLEPKESEA